MYPGITTDLALPRAREQACLCQRGRQARNEVFNGFPSRFNSPEIFARRPYAARLTASPFERRRVAA